MTKPASSAPAQPCNAALLCCLLLVASPAAARPLLQLRGLQQLPGSSTGAALELPAAAGRGTTTPQPTTGPSSPPATPAPITAAAQAATPTALDSAIQQPAAGMQLSQATASPALGVATQAPTLTTLQPLAEAAVRRTTAPASSAAPLSTDTAAVSQLPTAAVPQLPTAAAAAQPGGLNPLTASGTLATVAPAVSTPAPTTWPAASSESSQCSHRFELCSSDADCCSAAGARQFCMWSASLVQYDPSAPNDMRTVGSGVRFCGQAGDGHIVP